MPAQSDTRTAHQGHNMHPLIKTLIATSLIASLPGCATYDKLFGDDSTSNTTAAAVKPAKASAADKASAQKIDAQYSGYLVKYSDMKEVTNPSGDTSLRWVNPALKKDQYTAIMIDPVGFYPKPPRDALVSKGVMLQVVLYLAEQAKKEIGHDLKIVEQPGPGVLRWDAAITGVQVPGQTGSEVPVAKIFAEKTSAASPTAQSAVVYLESRLVDTQSKQVMAKSVRRAVGKPADSSAGKMTFEMIKPSLDNWVQDARAFVRQDIVTPKPQTVAEPEPKQNTAAPVKKSSTKAKQKATK
jgi:hypothetical protein